MATIAADQHVGCGRLLTASILLFMNQVEALLRRYRGQKLNYLSSCEGRLSVVMAYQLVHIPDSHFAILVQAGKVGPVPDQLAHVARQPSPLHALHASWKLCDAHFHQRLCLAEAWAPCDAMECITVQALKPLAFAFLCMPMAPAAMFLMTSLQGMSLRFGRQVFRCPALLYRLTSRRLAVLHRLTSRRLAFSSLLTLW